MGRSTRDSSLFACDQTNHVFHSRLGVFSRAVASCQLVSGDIDRTRAGNCRLYCQVSASPSFQHQSKAQRESDQSFNEEHRLLGDRAAATRNRSLVSNTVTASTRAFEIPKPSVSTSNHQLIILLARDNTSGAIVTPICFTLLTVSTRSYFFECSH